MIRAVQIRERRVGRAQPKDILKLGADIIFNQRTINWSGMAYPNEGWAQKIFGAPDVERLWTLVATAVRLDEPDPVAAWKDHLARLSQRAAALNERRFDAIRFRGPGTDLTVGLLPLGLPPNDPFWSDPPRPWTAQRAWSGQPFPIDHALAD